MLEAIRRRAEHQLRNVHLLVGRHRPGFADALSERARARRQGARAARLGRQPEDGRGAARRDEGGRRARSSAITRCTGTPGAHEQPHAPQAAGRRRPGGLHRRRRHRRQVGRATQDRPTTGATRTTGSRARRSRRCRRRSSTTGSRPPARCCRARTTFRQLRAAGDARAQVFTSSPSGGGESMQLMYLMSITAAEQHDRPVGVLLRARRADAAGASRGARARRARAHHRAGRAHRRRDRAQGLARATGANCWRPAPRSTSTSRPCSTARC